MTDGTRSRKAIRTARRRERYHAREVLRDVSTLARVRACGWSPQGSQHDARSGGQIRREPVIALRLAQGAEGRAASWSGVQSCGSTWACPVCSERIQARRNAEVASALAVARYRGWVVGFLTFTVTHKRWHRLAEVWGAVSEAWRRTTSGSPREWSSDRDAYGIRGYLRLTEVTHGANGWHVHVHALVFLDPFGRMVTERSRFIGPLPAPATPASHLAGRIGPQTREEAQRLDAWIYGPLTEAQTKLVEPGRGWVTTRSVQRSSGVAMANRYADLDAARERGLRAEHPYSVLAGAAEPRLYLRDVEALGARMGTRWIKALDGTDFKPGTVHGYDARIVTSERELGAYFAKNVYAETGAKSVESAAYEVTSSFSKQARRGNRTPFGILSDFTRTGDASDLSLWREWEHVSRGKRQLLWSNGLRAELGLAEDLSDDDAANEEAQGDDLLTVSVSSYRSIVRGGHGAAILHAAEISRHDLHLALLELGVAFSWSSRPTEESTSAVWQSLGYTREELPPST